MRMSWWLILVGGTLESVGVVLVASPELKSAATAIRDRTKRIRDRTRAGAGWLSTNARRLLRRRPRAGEVAIGGPISSGSFSAEASVHTRPSPDSSDEQVIAFLLKKHGEHVGRFARIEAELESQPERWRQDIEKARSELSAETRKEVERVRDSHIKLRISGVVILLVGILLVTAGNLV